MPTWTTIAQDDFSEAAGTDLVGKALDSGGNWQRENEPGGIAAGDIEVSTNGRVEVTNSWISAATEALFSPDGITANATQACAVDVYGANQNDLQGQGCLARLTMNDTGDTEDYNGYCATVNITTGRTRLARRDGTSATRLVNSNETEAAGDTIRQEWDGSSYELFHKGVSIATGTDANYATGTMGLGFSSTVEEVYDNFLAEHEAAAGGNNLFVRGAGIGGGLVGPPGRLAG